MRQIKVQKFSDLERTELLKVRGVGPAVIQRLEELGIFTLESLRDYEAEEITTMIASSMGSTCWKNSPLAKQAIEDAILMADNLALKNNLRS